MNEYDRQNMYVCVCMGVWMEEKFFEKTYLCQVYVACVTIHFFNFIIFIFQNKNSNSDKKSRKMNTFFIQCQKKKHHFHILA